MTPGPTRWRVPPSVPPAPAPPPFSVDVVQDDDSYWTAVVWMPHYPSTEPLVIARGDSEEDAERLVHLVLFHYLADLLAKLPTGASEPAEVAALFTRTAA